MKSVTVTSESQCRTYFKQCLKHREYYHKGKITTFITYYKFNLFLFLFVQTIGTFTCFKMYTSLYFISIIVQGISVTYRRYRLPICTWWKFTYRRLFVTIFIHFNGSFFRYTVRSCKTMTGTFSRFYKPFTWYTSIFAPHL